MSQPLTIETFKPLLNEEFVLETPPTTFVLSEVKAMSENEDEASRKVSFALLFLTTKEANLPQGTYILNNAKLGTVEIFMVPIGPNKEGMRYEAIFN